MTRPSPLLRQRDFLRLWAAQSVSSFGARIGREGLPILAVTTLAAGPAGLGLIAATRGAATLATGLFAGGLADGARRRLMIGADLARAGALLLLPLAAWLHALSLPLLALVTAGVAGLSTLFDMADHAFLPSLVRREEIGAANARLSATESLAETAGPAVAGVLFQLLTAPVAVIVNAATYLVSAAALARIETREAQQARAAGDRHPLAGLAAGVRACLGEPTAAAQLFLTSANGLFGGMFGALYILFVLKGLGLPTAVLGAGIACGGLASLAGSACALAFARVLGLGPAMLWTAAISALGLLPLLLVPPHGAWAVAGLVAQQLTGDFFGVIPLILGASLLQSTLPQAVLGRVRGFFQASYGFFGVIGALAGGALGAAIGPRDAMLWATAGLLIGPAGAALTPLARVKALPAEGAA